MINKKNVTQLNYFNLSAHIGTEHEHVNFFEKKDYSKQINLSSNQLEHPELTALFQTFLKDFDFTLVSQYVFLKSITEKACEFYQLEPGQIVFSAGSDIAIAHIVKSLTLKFRTMILQTPNYVTYQEQAVLNNINTIEVNFLDKTEGEHVSEIIETVIRNSPSLVVIANPNNSFGTILSLNSIESIADICLKYNSILLLDEAYTAFSQFDHVAIFKEYKNVIIVRTFSKSHGTAGLRLGCIMARQEIINYLKKTGLEKTVSVISLCYFQYLMRVNDKVVRIRNEIMVERDEFITWLKKYFLSWKVYSSSTNFVTIRVDSEEQAKDVTKLMLGHGIAIKQLVFNRHTANLIRISISNHVIMKQIKLFIKRKFLTESID
jgi:histidinol-phosphate aminotransferase